MSLVLHSPPATEHASISARAAARLRSIASRRHQSGLTCETGVASVVIRLDALSARFRADTGLGGGGAALVLARGLERIGWRSVRDPTPEVLASYLVMLLDACVHEHRDVNALTHGIATVFRDAGPLLDGGLPPIEAYLPAAEELLQHYVNNDLNERA